MNKKQIENYLQEGLNCSQTVLMYFHKRYDLSEKTASKIAQPFESGLFRGETCGAVSGADMVLGLEYGSHEENSRRIMKEKIEEYNKSFKEKMGTLQCEDRRDLSKGNNRLNRNTRRDDRIRERDLPFIMEEIKDRDPYLLQIICI